MNAQTEIDGDRPSEYETDQVCQISAWKSEPAPPLLEIWNDLMQPGVKVLEKVLPDRLARWWVEESYDVAAKLAGREDVKRQAGVQELEELRDRPLEECDQMARRVGAGAVAVALTEGAATGAGGVLTTLLDIPLLFVLSLRTILKIGHCYGYPLDRLRDRHYVLGVLVTALCRSLHVRRKRLERLRDLEDLLLVETQEELVTEEILSFLFQLEIFAEVPGVGALSGALLNLVFMRRVDVTARRVFQERWLHDNGKVAVIAPAAAPALHLAPGWSGALGRTAYSGCYYLGFGAAFPAYLVASLFRPMNTTLVRGF